MTDKQVIEGLNFTIEYPGVDWHISGRAGIVKNIRFVRCFWPRLDRPVALFAPGSGGIEVMGPPTPRNVVFPPDTVFLAQQADDGPIQSGSKPMRARRWRQTDVMTKSDCFFLRERKMAEYTEMVEKHEEHEIDGKLMPVKVMRPLTITREDDVLTDLTVEEARRIAGGDVLPR